MIVPAPKWVTLDYGQIGHQLCLNSTLADWTVIDARKESPEPDIRWAFETAVSKPVSAPRLSKIISAHDRVVIVTSDNTRPVPNKLLIPEIVRQCHLEPRQVTILIGTGSHRPLSDVEIERFLGSEISERFRVVCHDAADRESLNSLGRTPSGIPVHLNKEYLHADKRLVLGFIEPHLFAGFSGGAKGVCPAICGLETIDAFHSFNIIGHARSDYGYLEDNPQQLAAREVAALAPPDFLINVTLNSTQEITAIFAGDYIKAHRVGCAAVTKTAMVGVRHKYPIVITSNSGYPLDQNLYQSVKGIWTGIQIVEDGGAIILVSECSRGIPAGSYFAMMLEKSATPTDLLKAAARDDNHAPDRWQAQRLAMAVQKADIYVYSSLERDGVEMCRMHYVENLDLTLRALCDKHGPRPQIAVVPHGPLTVPYVE